MAASFELAEGMVSFKDARALNETDASADLLRAYSLFPNILKWCSYSFQCEGSELARLTFVFERLFFALFCD